MNPSLPSDEQVNYKKEKEKREQSARSHWTALKNEI